MQVCNNFSTTRLLNKLIEDNYLNENGIIKQELKYTINNPVLNIQNSKFIPNPEDKFETMLFLPPNPSRIAEGGLRTKGIFKFNYKLGMLNDELYKNAKNSTFNANHSKLNIQNSTLKEIWHISDLDGNPVVPVPDDIQSKINNYVSQFRMETPQFNIQNSTFNIISELPLITVITVVYNGAKYLEETIQSVINQTYPNVEYIIIDGGSRDGTIDIIRKYEDYVDYWVSEPDKGIYDAMNKGITLSTGELLGIINADDWYEANIFEVIIEKYKKSYKEAILHGDINIIKDENLFYVSKPKKNLSILKKGMIINHPSVFIPFKIYKKVGFFSIEYKIASDWDFMLRCYMHNINFFYLNIVISNFRLGGVSFAFDRNHANEKHLIRKNNFVYKIFDKYYVYDITKINILGKYLHIFSNLKQALFSRLR